MACDSRNALSPLDAAESLLLSGQLGWDNVEDLDEEILRYRACIKDLIPAIGGPDPATRQQHSIAAPTSMLHALPTIAADMSNAQYPHARDAEHASVRHQPDQPPQDEDTDMVEHEAAPSGAFRDPTPGPSDDMGGGAVNALDPAEWQVPPHCIPIHANVTTYDWRRLYEAEQFDVIMMDPPWQLATSNPTRGVSLGYSQLTDADIANLPVPQLQAEGGFLFVWVINYKYKYTLDLFEKWGYKVVDEIIWVKMTVNRRMAKSHGYYLQHAKEVCLVGKRGRDPPGMAGGGGGVCSDVIFSERRGQSQKPEEIYKLIEELVPGGRYLEIFARKNNLRDYWVSIGNEVTGTGLPEADMDALRHSAAIPNAVYGRANTRERY